jgi:hypothetical protein
MVTIMAFFTSQQKDLINKYPITDIVDAFRNGLPKNIDFDQYILSAATDEGT